MSRVSHRAPTSITRPPRRRRSTAALAKALTGISGLDQITGGGIPRGRPTLVCGGAGCGKSVLALEVLVRGATQLDEPGLLVSFEETAEDVRTNAAALGFDVDGLIARNKLAIEYIHVDPAEIEEAGDYDLSGLFVRLDEAIASIGAKRIVLDTLETLFAGFTNEGILRAEVRRLFAWLKERDITAIVTAERTGDAFTRNGLEEFVSDCVIVLDHRSDQQVSTRRLRVVKYRGSSHGTDEYPFLIDRGGVSVVPVTSIGLDYEVSTDRVSSGIPKLDEMIGKRGYFRGSSVLVSGGAGTGKSSIAAHFVNAACGRGERCIYFALEESPSQIIRNMRSIGIDLAPSVDRGLLRFESARPTLFGLEMHLARMHRAIEELAPRVVVIDPLSSFTLAGTRELKVMLIRLLDFMKTRKVTALMTSLTAEAQVEATDTAVSSLIDTWLEVRDIETSGERNRGLHVLKSRGMAHSKQVREFVMSSNGIDLVDVVIGPDGVLTGSARAARDAREKADAITQGEAIDRQKRALAHRRRVLDAHIAAMRAELAAEEESVLRTIDQGLASETRSRDARARVERLRTASLGAPKREGGASR